MSAEIRIRPLSPERWPDLELLFGPRGACAGCWCMWWRVPRSEWRRGKGKGNWRAFRDLVRSGEPTGLLAYAGKDPVGWVAVAPREAYPGLDRARTLKRIDERPVWSVTCFFVARPFRRRGLTVRLLEAAAALARSHGATVLEGYPVVSRKGAVPDAWAFTGVVDAFRRAGFREVARPTESRRIVRRELA